MTARAALFILTSIIVMSAKALTLPEALKQAFDYSPALKKTQSAVAGTEYEISKARAALFPTINGIGVAQTKQSPTTITGVNLPNGGTNVTETYTLGLELSQPLYVGGAISSGVAYYKVNDELARQGHQVQRQTLAGDTVKAFYELAKAQERLKLAKENRDILKAYLDITTRYQNIGRVKRTDRMQANVNVMQAVVDIQQSETDLSRARIRLSELVGGPLASGADIPTTLPRVEEVKEDKVVDAAFRNNPSVRQSALTVEQVGYAEGLDLSADAPSLYLTGGAGYTSSDRATVSNETSRYYVIALNLKIPIFSGFSSFAKRGTYAEKKVQAEKELELTRSRVKETALAALLQLRNQEAQLKILEEAAGEARQALSIANRGYEQGTVSSQDVINLQRTRFDAEKLLMTVQYGYLQAVLDLRAALGIDLEKAYATK